MSSPKPQLIRKFFRDHIEVIAITLLIAVCLRFFVIGAYRIPNSNMLPTLRAGDFVFGFRLPYGLRLPILGTRMATDHLPKRGDLVIFQIRDESLESYTLLQRVIGLPGDRIEVRKGHVILNGIALEYTTTPNPEKLVLTNGNTEMMERLDSRVHAVILPPAVSSSLQLIEKLKEEKARAEKHRLELLAKKKKAAAEARKETQRDNQKNSQKNDQKNSQIDAQKSGGTETPTGKETESGDKEANGQKKLREEAPEKVNTGEQEPLVVPPHSIYLLGDDRSLSDDSRQFGTVLSADIEAQAFLIWLSLDWQGSGLPSVRWDRVLREIE